MKYKLNIEMEHMKYIDGKGDTRTEGNENSLELTNVAIGETIEAKNESDSPIMLKIALSVLLLMGLVLSIYIFDEGAKLYLGSLVVLLIIGTMSNIAPEMAGIIWFALLWIITFSVVAIQKAWVFFT